MLFNHNLNKANNFSIIETQDFCISNPVIDTRDLTHKEIEQILSSQLSICKLCNKPILSPYSPKPNPTKIINPVLLVPEQKEPIEEVNQNNNQNNQENTNQNLNKTIVTETTEKISKEQDIKQEETENLVVHQQQSVQETEQNNNNLEETIIIKEENIEVIKEKEEPKSEEKVEKPKTTPKTTTITKAKSKSTGNLNTNSPSYKFIIPKYALLNKNEKLIVDLNINSSDNAVSFARRNLTKLKTDRNMSSKLQLENVQVLHKLSLELRNLYIKLNPKKLHALT